MEYQNGRKDNIDFSNSENIRLAEEALQKAKSEFGRHFLSQYHVGTDKTTQEIIYFFSTSNLWGLNRYSENEKEYFLDLVRKCWKTAGFIIVSEHDVSSREYLHINYPSYSIRLRCNTT